MLNKKFLLVFVVLAAVAGYFYTTKKEPPTVASIPVQEKIAPAAGQAYPEELEPTHPENEETLNPEVAEQPVSPPAPSEPKPAGNRLFNVIPSVQTLQDEVKENPQTIPASLITFAADLGPKMEKAMQNEDSATALIGELEECAVGKEPEVPLVIQSICLSNARILSRKHPKLDEKFQAILPKANPDAAKLIR